VSESAALRTSNVQLSLQKAAPCYRYQSPFLMTFGTDFRMTSTRPLIPMALMCLRCLRHAALLVVRLANLERDRFNHNICLRSSKMISEKAQTAQVSNKAESFSVMFRDQPRSVCELTSPISTNKGPHFATNTTLNSGRGRARNCLNI
jgi:hypothetical protein